MDRAPCPAHSKLHTHTSPIYFLCFTQSTICTCVNALHVFLGIPINHITNNISPYIGVNNKTTNLTLDLVNIHTSVQSSVPLQLAQIGSDTKAHIHIVA